MADARPTTPRLAATRPGVDELCDRFDSAWRDGKSPRLEEYLAEASEDARPSLLAELLRVELWYRRKAGEEPAVEPYLARFASMEAAVREAFGVPGRGEPPWNDVERDTPTTAFSTTGDGAGAAGRRAAPADAILPEIPGYLVERKLGEGGMGIVYLARDVALHRAVALKTLRPGAVSCDSADRFLTEARAVASLDHPNVVKVFEVGEWAGSGGNAAPYLALEYVPGGSLARRLTGGPLPVAEAARVVRLLARAVAHAHERGIAHRDLKPDNVLIATHQDEPGLNAEIGCPKVTDFGLALSVGGDRRLTKSGVAVGTPSYMAPEQATGRAGVGPKADVWALGVILYELLTGEVPFVGSTAMEVLYKACHDPPPPVREKRPDVPEDLERLYLSCLEKPQERRPTASELALSLEPFTTSDARGSMVDYSSTSSPSNSGRRRLFAGVAAVVLLLSGACWLAADRARHVPDDPPLAGAPAPEPEGHALSQAALRISPLRVTHYAPVGAKHLLKGVIGEESFRARFNDAVTVTVELSEPAYFYVVAFNFDGKEQLVWPADAQGKGDEKKAPPKLQRLRHPEGITRLYLDDDEKGGLQAYAVAASRSPLPPYAEWQRARGPVAWGRLAAGESVWQADAKGVYEARGKGRADRGSVKEDAGLPPLGKLCAALEVGGVEAVEAVAFGVMAKEGGR